jgi:hypothetical protein
MVDMFIAMASGQTITFPEADLMEGLKPYKKSD